mgnify:CR=1 FL=1
MAWAFAVFMVVGGIAGLIKGTAVTREIKQKLLQGNQSEKVALCHVSIRRIVLALAVCGLVAVTFAAGPVAAASRMQTQGRWIVDDQGRVVLPVGVNLVNKVAPYTVDALGFDEDDAQFLKDEGFTSVRLGVIWKEIEPLPGQYNTEYLDSIKQTIELLNSYGITTMVDQHQDMLNEQFQGQGFPDWAIYTDGWPNIIKAGFPGNQFVNTALQHAYDNFHANKTGPSGIGIANRFASMWGFVAGYLKDTEGIIGYDLYNEPWPGTSWVSCLTTAFCTGPDGKLAGIQQKATDKIHAVDPRVIVFYEPYSLFNQGTQTNVKTTGANTAFSFHVYCPSQFNGNYWACVDQDKRVFANADNHATPKNQPALLTEFGALKDSQVLRAQSDLAMSRKMGWYYWSYTGKNDITTSGPGEQEALVFDPAEEPSGDNIDDGKLAQLVVMHPNAVAGTPASYAYNRDTGVFTMTWSTMLPKGTRASNGAVTEIAVPTRTAPNGYTVEVTGGIVISAPDAPVLDIAQAGTPSQVTVKVTRAY